MNYYRQGQYGSAFFIHVLMSTVFGHKKHFTFEAYYRVPQPRVLAVNSAYGNTQKSVRKEK
jgi:hypothetical protein